MKSSKPSLMKKLLEREFYSSSQLSGALKLVFYHTWRLFQPPENIFQQCPRLLLVCTHSLLCHQECYAWSCSLHLHLDCLIFWNICKLSKLLGTLIWATLLRMVSFILAQITVLIGTELTGNFLFFPTVLIFRIYNTLLFHFQVEWCSQWMFSTSILYFVHKSRSSILFLHLLGHSCHSNICNFTGQIEVLLSICRTQYPWESHTFYWKHSCAIQHWRMGCWKGQCQRSLPKDAEEQERCHCSFGDQFCFQYFTLVPFTHSW